jgi:FdhD protein
MYNAGCVTREMPMGRTGQATPASLPATAPPSPPSRSAAVAVVRPIVALRKGTIAVSTDSVATEQPLTLFINDRELFTILCSPGEIEELALGYLFSEGLVRSATDIRNMVPDTARGQVFVRLRDDVTFDWETFSRQRTISSGCARGLTLTRRLEESGIPPVKARFDIGFDELTALMSHFLQLSEHHHQTGCIHVAALVGATSIKIFREDIGRHNAIDKVIGAAMAQHLPIEQSALLVSGRISSEMILKGARAGIPLVATRAAATDAAIGIADKLGITLAGFVRAHRINIYSHPWRITETRGMASTIAGDDDG